MEILTLGYMHIINNHTHNKFERWLYNEEKFCFSNNFIMSFIGNL